MKKIFILAIVICSVSKTFAQQEAMFTHYMFNTLAVNPAYAGSRDALTFTGLHRSQWVGFEGAPITQTITLHSPILNNKIGLGLSVLNDKIGPVQSTTVNADFAYKIQVGKKANLAFGIKGGLNMRSAGLSSLKLDNQLDDSFTNNVQKDLLPNFGFGMYYSRERFYAGISTPSMLESNFTTKSVAGSIAFASEARHYFVILGTVFNLTNNGSIKLKPTTLIKVTNGAPIEGDVTTVFLFNDKFWLGAMYRTGDAAGLLMGYNITDQFSVGYSFDWSFTNSTGKYNSGSHEIMLRYDFIYTDQSKIRSPRYF